MGGASSSKKEVSDVSRPLKRSCNIPLSEADVNSQLDFLKYILHSSAFYVIEILSETLKDPREADAPVLFGYTKLGSPNRTSQSRLHE